MSLATRDWLRLRSRSEGVGEADIVGVGGLGNVIGVAGIVRGLGNVTGVSAMVVGMWCGKRQTQGKWVEV